MNKKCFFAAIVAATTLLSACGSLNTTSVSNALNTAASAATTAANISNTIENKGTNLTATEAGSATGDVLKALYAQYKAAGKLDYKDATTYANVVNLIANCSALPANVKNKTYLKEFGSGMIGTSAGLVNSINVDGITQSLTDMASQYTPIISKDASASDRLTGIANATNALSALLAGINK